MNPTIGKGAGAPSDHPSVPNFNSPHLYRAMLDASFEFDKHAVVQTIVSNDIVNLEKYLSSKNISFSFDYKVSNGMKLSWTRTNGKFRLMCREIGMSEDQVEVEHDEAPLAELPAYKKLAIHCILPDFVSAFSEKLKETHKLFLGRKVGE